MLRVDAVCSRKLMRCHIQSVYGAMNLEGCSEGLGVAGSETAAETAAASASLSRRCRSASRYSDSSLPFNRTLTVVSVERGVGPDLRARLFLVIRLV